MGKGDKRSFKGKVFRHSYGKTRPRHKAPATGSPGQPGTSGEPGQDGNPGRFAVGAITMKAFLDNAWAQ